MDKSLFPLTSYTISNSIVGARTTIIQANAQTPPAGISIAAFDSLVSDLRLTIPVAANTPQIHHPVTVMTQLRTSSALVLGARVSGLLVRPDGSTTTITLLDDGQHGDNAAGDGIYGFQFTPTISGVYSAAITASGTNGNVS
ncbi:MAG: choice-of-anchor X domain-containing protein, partial [Roseiflexaceae bacterium]